jgi:dTDP-4-amino-4,6-dideoxygalactose transaminase
VDVARAKVGDIGFSLDEVDLAMSEISARLLARLDFDVIRERRIDNYRRLAQHLDGRVELLHRHLADGICPLLLPILVQQKRRTAEALRARGVEALEFWNEGAAGADDEGAHARYLRNHVLGLPIHQDLDDRRIDYVAAQVLSLDLPMGARR